MLAGPYQLHDIAALAQAADQTAQGHGDTVDFRWVGLRHQGDAQRCRGTAEKLRIDDLHAAMLASACDVLMTLWLQFNDSRCSDRQFFICKNFVRHLYVMIK